MFIEILPFLKFLVPQLVKTRIVKASSFFFILWMWDFRRHNSKQVLVIIQILTQMLISCGHTCTGEFCEYFTYCWFINPSVHLLRFKQWAVGETSVLQLLRVWAGTRMEDGITAPREELFTKSSICQRVSTLWQVGEELQEGGLTVHWQNLTQL